MWHDEKFASLDQLQKLIVFYAITAQSNRIGLFKFSAALAAEELGTSPKTFLEGFENVCRALNWEWDRSLRVVYLPTWWKYNQPENPNVLLSCLADLDDLPQSPLVARFCANLGHLKGTLHQTFLECLGERYKQPMPHHEHEHEHNHEHEHEHNHEHEKNGAAPPLGLVNGSQTSPTPKKSKPPAFDPLAIEFPPAMRDPRFLEAWSAWIKYRRSARLTCVKETIIGQAELLSTIGPVAAAASIETSICRGWKAPYYPPVEKKGTLVDAAMANYAWAQEEESKHGSS
jgi:hypothetical protein